jgi:tetratricopeptide (TPR) repeat protein
VYHGKVAQTLEANAEEGKLPLSDLAYQYAQAGSKEKAVKYALAAGQDALAKWSNAEAIKHFSYVVQAVGENLAQLKLKMTAMEGLGDAYFADDNFQQAVNVYEQFADHQSGTDRLRGLRKAAQAAFYHGDVPKQKELLQKAEAIATDDRLEAARFMYQKGAVAGAESDWVGAFTLDYAALAIFEEEYAVSEAANILLWLGYGSAMLGKLEEGITSALMSIALYDDLGDVRSQMEAYAYAGGTFQACMFIDNSNKMLAKTEEINEKYRIADYIKLIPANVWWSHGLIQQDPVGSITKALKALEYSEKTDARLYTGAIYGTLIIQHAFAGDMNHVDEYYSKLMSLPKYIIENAPSQIYFPTVMGVYYAAKNDFEKSSQCFNQALSVSEKYFPNPFMLASSRQLYAWALSKQGKIEGAKAQLKETQRITENVHTRFSQVNIQPIMMTLTRPTVNQTFPFRLDLVNVSTSQGSIVKIENLPKELEIVEVSPNCVLHDDCIEFKDSKIDAFIVKSVKLTLKTTENTSFTLNPKITYVNNLGETKICNPKPLMVTVRSQPESKPHESLAEETSEIDILKKFGLSRSP